MSSDLKTTCLCGIDVHRGTKIVGWISLVCAAISLNVIGVAVCGILLYGIEKKRPDYYLPYLTLQAIGIVLQCAVVIYILFVHDNHQILHQNGVVFVVVFLTFFILLAIVSVYFFFVIPLHSYKLMKYEIGQGSYMQQLPTSPPAYNA